MNTRRIEELKSNDRYSLKTIFGLSVLYYFAVIIIAFFTVFLEFSNAKEIRTDTTWFWLLPLPTPIVTVDFLFYILGIIIAVVGCLLLWKWHSFVLSQNAEDYTKGWRVGYKVILILSVILCLLAGLVAYVIVLTGSLIDGEKILAFISLFLVPTMIVVFDIRKGRHLYKSRIS